MVELAFAIAGALLLLGFLGNYLFKKFSIPDVLILIFLGFLLGPFFKIIDVSILYPILPIFASLALLTILFDAGLNLNLHEVIKESPRAISLAVLNVFIAILITTFLTTIFLNWDLLYGVLLGSIIGGTSSSIVIPLVSRIKNREKVKVLLSLESVFTDVIVIVLSLTLFQIISAKSVNLENALQSIASAFSVGIVVGLIVGIAWLRVLKSIKGEVYDDILTLSIALLFYAIVEVLGGNGAIFALVFGLVLGNGKQITSFLKMEEFEASKIMKKFQSQISFFLRTFFFVYLGLIISFQNYNSLLFAVIITFSIFALRWISSEIICWKDEELSRSKELIAIMLPRGLAAAILAQFTLNYSLPHTDFIINFVTGVILFSVIISVVGASLVNKKFLKGENEEKEKKTKG